MKATIGVYNDHHAAVEAVNALKAEGFPAKQISILGHAVEEGESEAGEGIDSDEVWNRPAKVAATTVGISAIVGPIVGALAGIGLLAIPGLGLLVGAGAIAGAVAGLEVGLVGGGIISALAIAGMNKHHEDLYHEHLSQGKFIVVASGSSDEVAHAKEVLHAHDEHLHLETHA